MASGKITIKIAGDASDLRRALGGAQSSLGTFGASVGRVAASAAKAFTAMSVAAGGLAVVLGKQAVDAASNLQETINRTSVVLGDAAGDVLAWSDQSASALGMSRRAALDAAATFATFGKSAGLGGSDLAEFSTGLTQLAADLASFANTTPEEAITAIGAALRGESEPIRRYGVLLDEATLRQRAFAMGIVSSTTTALTPQQRVLAAHAEILAQTTDAQGDFARTADSAANKQRTLSAQLEDLSARVGTLLLPVFSALVDTLSTDVLPVVERVGTRVAEWAADLQPVIDRALPVMRDLWREAADVFRDQVIPAVDRIADAFVGLLPAVRDTAQDIGSTLLPIIRQAVPVVATVVAGVLRFVRVLLDNRKTVLAFAVPIGAAVVAIKGLQVARTVAGALGALRTAMLGVNAAFAANPITLVVAALAALVAGVIYAYRNFEPFRRAVDAAGRAVRDAFGAALNFVRSTILPIFQSAVQRLAPIVSNVFNTIRSVIASVMQVIRGIINTVLGLLTGDWSRAWSGIKQALSGVWSAIAAVVSGGLNHLRLIVATGIGFVWDQIRGLPGRILGVVGAMASAAGALGRAILYGIRNAFTSAVGFAADLASGLWRTLKNLVNEQIIDRINNAIPDKISVPGPLPDINLPDNPIPRLARGAVIDRPTLAWVGEDARTAPEIVTPEMLMRRIVREEMGASGPTVVQLVVDRQVLGAVVVDVLARESRRRGSLPIRIA